MERVKMGILRRERRRRRRIFLCILLFEEFVPPGRYVHIPTPTYKRRGLGKRGEERLE